MTPEAETTPAEAASASVTYALPAEPLRAAITTYYLVKVTGPGTVRDQIFPEWPNFRLILSGRWEAKFPDVPVEAVPMAGVTGALERAVWVEGTAGLMVGVGLMPQGWPRLTPRPADEFADRMRPMTDCLGPAADALYDRLKAAAPDDDALYAILDEVLGGLMTEAPEADLVARTHAGLQDPAVQTVADWAGVVGLSSRQLERISLRYFGLPPKRLLRRQRVLRTLAAMRESQGTCRNRSTISSRTRPTSSTNSTTTWASRPRRTWRGLSRSWPAPGRTAKPCWARRFRCCSPLRAPPANRLNTARSPAGTSYLGRISRVALLQSLVVRTAINAGKRSSPGADSKVCVVGEMREGVDIVVGRRLRARRRLLGLSQQALGGACGVTFQQIHKYESAVCRLSANMLWKIACALDVEMSYFFVGLPRSGEADSEAQVVSLERERTLSQNYLQLRTSNGVDAR